MLYRGAFLVALVLYVACFVSGARQGLLSHGRLPAITTDVMTQAEEQLARGDVKGAAQEYRMASRINRGDYQITLELARLLNTIGDQSGEIDQYERARELWPKNPVVYRGLGWAYKRNRRPAEALTAFAAAARLDPGYVDAYVGEGEVLLDLDRPRDAIAAFAAAVRLDPSQGPVHNSLGVALALSDRPAEAVGEFEAAVRLDPRPDFAENLARARAASAGATRP